MDIVLADGLDDSVVVLSVELAGRRHTIEVGIVAATARVGQQCGCFDQDVCECHYNRAKSIGTTSAQCEAVLYWDFMVDKGQLLTSPLSFVV